MLPGATPVKPLRLNSRYWPLLNDGRENNSLECPLSQATKLEYLIAAHRGEVMQLIECRFLAKHLFLTSIIASMLATLPFSRSSDAGESLTTLLLISKQR
jgi:hypothetical protein